MRVQQLTRDHDTIVMTKTLLRTSSEKNIAAQNVFEAWAEKKLYELPLMSLTTLTVYLINGSLDGLRRSTMGLTMKSAMPSDKIMLNITHPTTSIICFIVSLFLMTT